MVNIPDWFKFHQKTSALSFKRTWLLRATKSCHKVCVWPVKVLLKDTLRGTLLNTDATVTCFFIQCGVWQISNKNLFTCTISGNPLAQILGTGIKGMTKTRRRYRRHVKPWRSWSCSYLPTVNGGLIIGLVLNKHLRRTFGMGMSPFV